MHAPLICQRQEHGGDKDTAGSGGRATSAQRAFADLGFYLYSVQYHDTWVRTCMLSTLLVDSPTTRTERRAMQMSQTATPSPLGSENPATDKLTISTAARLKYGTRFNPLGSSCHHSPFCARARAQSGAGRMI